MIHPAAVVGTVGANRENPRRWPRRDGHPAGDGLRLTASGGPVESDCGASAAIRRDAAESQRSCRDSPPLPREYPDGR